jgi:RAB protein geranylgeranyltransferase component A
LSRSDKKVLHVDENEYYGGSEASFSLQELEEWALRNAVGMILVTNCPEFSDDPRKSSHTIFKLYHLEA